MPAEGGRLAKTFLGPPADRPNRIAGQSSGARPKTMKSIPGSA
jgi:hypothetical protein